MPILERAQEPDMLTGSVASSAHGMPRSTRDLNIVIATSRTQLQARLQQFPGDRYYADQEQTLRALGNTSQFDVIDFATGWKVDFIIAANSEYGRTAMARRILIDLAGTPVYVSSPEDVLIAKLRWAKLSGSDRQLQDATGIVRTQSSRVDLSYIERWVRELLIEEQWNAVREGGSEN